MITLLKTVRYSCSIMFRTHEKFQLQFVSKNILLNSVKFQIPNFPVKHGEFWMAKNIIFHFTYKLRLLPLPQQNGVPRIKQWKFRFFFSHFRIPVKFIVIAKSIFYRDICECNRNLGKHLPRQVKLGKSFTEMRLIISEICNISQMIWNLCIFDLFVFFVMMVLSARSSGIGSKMRLLC